MTNTNALSKEARPQGGALRPKLINQKPRSRTKFGMTKRPELNRHVMLNLGLMKIRLVSASGFLILCFQQTHLSSPSTGRGFQMRI
jgi:hypothetical protein